MSANAKLNLPAGLQKMDSEVIKEISAIVGKLTGVQLGSKQAAMVQSRLVKRMIELNIQDSKDYLNYIHDNFKSESQVLVSLLTTHHTFFFREFFHFEFLLKTGLPRVIEAAKKRGANKIRIWSAACSYGQEAYSLSMYLSHHLPQLSPGMTYEIFGSDVDPDSVKIARNGVYRFDQIKEIPTLYAGDNWTRGTGDIADFVKAKPGIKNPCRFDVKNLFDLSDMKGEMFDIIFCRNVFIYFNLDQIKLVTSQLLDHLHPEGYFFLGLSESLNGLRLPVKQLGPSVYEKEGAKLELVKPVAPTAKKTTPQASPGRSVSVAPTVSSTPAIIRVMCVDDSPVVLSILKKVLVKEQGFEVVATASNGLEAAQILKKQPVDLMTLDIHMPEQNGIEYLQKNFSSSHPPVIMISSASREDSQFGVKSLELGAVDFIEKPTLANLNEKSDEIRMKIRCAIDFYKESKKAKSMNLEKSFNFSTEKVKAEGNLRVIIGSLGDLQKIKEMLKTISGEQPPFFMFIHGGEHFLSHLPDQLKTRDHKAKLFESVPSQLRANEIGVASFDLWPEFHKKFASQLRTHVMVLGEPTSAVAREIHQIKGSYILLEETAVKKMHPEYEKLKVVSSEIIPYTSMIYHSDRGFLIKGG